jgi:hypothetical protein
MLQEYQLNEALLKYHRMRSALALAVHVVLLMVDP